MRTVRAITGVAAAGLVLVLAGCSTSGAEAPETPPQTDGSTQAPAKAGPEVRDPKNATALDVCELLPPEAAAELGVGPEGELESNDLDTSVPRSCTWSGPDGSLKVNLLARDDRSLQHFYDNEDQYQTFERIEVSGHPAVIAIETDATVSCDVFLASKQGQVVSSTTFLPSEDVGKVNPCDVTKKMFELSIPSWPAA